MQFLAIVANLFVCTLAARLFGATNGNTDPSGQSRLFEIDTASGVAAFIGNTGVKLSGMAENPITGVLFGVTSKKESTPNLVTINKGTGVATVVAALTGNQAAADLTIDSAGQAFTWREPSDDDLGRVDLVSGLVTTVGESGLGTGELSLAVNPSGDVVLVESLNVYIVDKTTGAPDFQFTLPDTPNGLAHHGKFDPATGLFWALDETSGSRNLVVFDFSSQSIVSTFATENHMHVLAFIGSGCRNRIETRHSTAIRNNFAFCVGCLGARSESCVKTETLHNVNIVYSAAIQHSASDAHCTPDIVFFIGLRKVAKTKAPHKNTDSTRFEFTVRLSEGAYHLRVVAEDSCSSSSSDSADQVQFINEAITIATSVVGDSSASDSDK